MDNQTLEVAFDAILDAKNVPIKVTINPDVPGGVFWYECGDAWLYTTQPIALDVAVDQKINPTLWKDTMVDFLMQWYEGVGWPDIELANKKGDKACAITPHIGGGYRTTYFDKEGPYMHVERSSIELCFEDAVLNRFYIPSEGMVDFLVVS